MPETSTMAEKMSMTPKSYQEFLIAELKTRQLLNPRFSLRSFAKFLSMSPSQLSQLISGKRNLTPKQALKIAEKLGLTRRQVQTLLAPFDKKTELEHEDYRKLEDQEFSLISDWKYYAILSLSKVSRNKADPHWIAKRLGISVEEASSAFQRLLDLQYLHATRAGGFRRSVRSLTISSPHGSAEIRKFHHQTLEIAQNKIDEIEPGLRDYSSVTMAFSLSKLEKARMMIADFRRTFATEMEIGDKNDVYTLAIQFFPLTALKEPTL